MPSQCEPEELLSNALAVIDRAFATPTVYERKTKKGVSRREKFPRVMYPLFSGGHDSTCACHVASRHPRFTGEVHFIDTGIGSRATGRHAEAVCKEFGWTLRVWKSPATYEKFVSRLGFPGPGVHQWVYNWLKDRCIARMTRGLGQVALVTGCRSQESVRRMGHVQPVKVGDRSTKTGDLYRPNRVWTAPCHDWSSGEQAAYMDYFEIPRNPVKLALGMSGECFCGAFAAPGELDRIRRHCPDVAEEIDRLAVIARECGKHAVWGTRPSREKGVVAVQSGPLCSSCDRRAVAAGIVFADD